MKLLEDKMLSRIWVIYFDLRPVPLFPQWSCSLLTFIPSLPLAGLEDSGILVMAVTDEVPLVAEDAGQIFNLNPLGRSVTINGFLSISICLFLVHLTFTSGLTCPRRGCFRLGNRAFSESESSL